MPLGINKLALSSALKMYSRRIFQIIQIWVHHSKMVTVNSIYEMMMCYAHRGRIKTSMVIPKIRMVYMFKYKGTMIAILEIT